MAKAGLLYISEEDIKTIKLDDTLVIETLKRTIAEHGRGAVHMPPNLHLTPRPDAEIDGMAAFLPSLRGLGLKWVASFPQNNDLGLPQTTALLILNEVETGLPIAVIEAASLTARRTGAVTAVSAMYLAKPDPKILAIIGCGVQGRSNLLALRRCFQFDEIRVFDVRDGAAVRYVEEMRPLVDAEIRIAANVRAAVEGADIIVTATATLTKPAPFIKDEWLAAGALAMPLDVNSAWEYRTIREVDKFVTDTWHHIANYADHGSFPEGLPVLYAELGQIVAGLKPGRQKSSERIMVMNTGMAIEDVALGQLVYDRASDIGVGTRLPFG